MVRSLSYRISFGLLGLLLALLSLTHTACDGIGKNPYELGPYKWGKYWRSFVYFKEGTWWVYRSIQDRDTLYDTVKVVASNWEMVRYADESPRNWKVTKEWFRYVMTSTVQGDVIHESPHVGTLGAADTMHYSRFLLQRSVWGNGQTTPFFIFRPDYQGAANGVGETIYEGVKSVRDGGSVNYDGVHLFSMDTDATWGWNGSAAKYYWAQNVGLVRRENLSTGETWELIDYEIM